MQVRWLLGWRAAEYDGWIHRGTIPLTDLQPGEMDLFTSYALAGFVLPTSSFFLTLLETYGLQLHHLTLHVLTLVVVFIQLCEMYIGCSPRCGPPGGVQAIWGPTTSSTRGSPRPRTFLPSPPANGTTGGMIR
jgi:hypothetical protein